MHAVVIPAPQRRHVKASIPARHSAAAPPWGFPELFVISQTALPALLFLPGSQSLRVPIRVGAFAISLVGLMYWWHAKRTQERGLQPVRLLLCTALAYLGLMLLHPTTSGLRAGLAQIILYLAVCAPVFWAPALVRDQRHLARLLVLLFICNGLNSLVGVLQVYNPAVWMPQELSRVVIASRYGLDAVSYIGPEGKRIIRPPGLFDSPGAVCGPAMITVLLGLAFTAVWKGLPKKLFACAMAVIGIAAIYLTHVRSSLIVVTMMVFALSGILMFMQKEKLRAAVLLGLYGLMILAAFFLAVALGGQSIRDRFVSLVEQDPIEIFYKSRGEQLENGFRTLLSDYPFGAGLGRWGIINAHFGDPYDTKASPIWAEVQTNAWLIDGGLVLLALYGGALVLNTRNTIRLVRAAGAPERRLLAVAVLAANVGTLVLVLSFTPFTGQIGLQYWLLSGALHGAMALRPGEAK